MSDSEEREAQRREAARAARVEARLKRMKRPGHHQTLFQQAMIACLASIEPACEPYYQKELDAIRDAVRRNGIWEESQEWRISTYFVSRIEKKQRDGKDWFRTSVECDGQRLSCECPTVEKAFAFVHLYQRLIVDQFYSIGPPWADNHVFEP